MRRGPKGPSSTASSPITESLMCLTSSSTDADMAAPLCPSDAVAPRLFREGRGVVEAAQDLPAAGEDEPGDRRVVDGDERERPAARGLAAQLGDEGPVRDDDGGARPGGLDHRG